MQELYIDLRINEVDIYVSTNALLISNTAVWENPFPVLNLPRDEEKFEMEFEVITTKGEIVGKAKSFIVYNRPRKGIELC